MTCIHRSWRKISLVFCESAKRNNLKWINDSNRIQVGVGNVNLLGVDGKATNSEDVPVGEKNDTIFFFFFLMFFPFNKR